MDSGRSPRINSDVFCPRRQGRSLTLTRLFRSAESSCCKTLSTPSSSSRAFAPRARSSAWFRRASPRRPPRQARRPRCRRIAPPSVNSRWARSTWRKTWRASRNRTCFLRGAGAGQRQLSGWPLGGRPRLSQPIPRSTTAGKSTSERSPSSPANVPSGSASIAVRRTSMARSSSSTVNRAPSSISSRAPSTRSAIWADPHRGS